jgi:hypothetical protein
MTKNTASGNTSPKSLVTKKKGFVTMTLGAVLSVDVVVAVVVVIVDVVVADVVRVEGFVVVDVVL